MEIEYKRDLNSNYMILKCNETLNLDSFQVRMLQSNHIPGLLDLSIREMNNRSLLYYDITSRQSFRYVLEHHMVSYKMLKDLFRSFFRVLDQLQEYLLPTDGLMLQTELIYTEGSWENFTFVFLPGRGQQEPELQKKLTALMEMILPKLDHSNQQGVVLGYNLYREVTGDEFSLNRLKTLVLSEQVSDSENLFSGVGIERQEPKTEDSAYRTDAEWELEEEKRAEDIVDRLRADESDTGEFPVFFAAYLPGILLLAGGSFVWIEYGLLLYAGTMAALGFLALAGAVAWQNRRAHRRMEEKQNAWNRLHTQEEISEQLMQAGLKPELLPGQKEKSKPAEEISGREDTKTHDTTPREVKTPIPKKMLYEVTEVLYLSEKEELQCRLIPENPELPILDFGQKSVLLVGKLASAVDYVLPVTTVSRMHAKLERVEDQILLADLNSRNGTFVNGELLQNGQTIPLSHGDEVVFADQKYKVEIHL